ncbi:hypothetical protein [Paenibacillus sp. UNC499MF]|uniref:hypothetical protein n=1 Tax=Paenibacillus sp. UNC499MF TaxID=1502751 RepID=UPI0008A086B4|nr:hypothetical protein [Paenibacillus sp. UNC499MF]SEF85518.1 hypothetical protein SAMN02799616_01233 [Paenibacillus sp. UNC499MF]
MKEMTSKFIIATAILAAPAAGTALQASAQTVAVQAQPAVQPAVEGVQAVQPAPSGTLTHTGISHVKTDLREILPEFGGAGNFTPSVVTKTPA